MTMPPEIAQASTQFMELLGALKQRASLQTHNQCYAMLRAVLHGFRGYMTVTQAIAFAGGLPPVVRAIFLADWRPDEAPPPPPPSRQEFAAAVVKRLAPHHIPPDSIVSDVFAVLAYRADPARTAEAIDMLPAGLKQLWHGEA